MEESNKIILQCDCSGEMLVVEANDFEINQLEFTLAIFTQGTYTEKPSLWWRIKYAWNHLRTGKIYSDYMWMDDKKAEALAKFIKENIERRRHSSI